MLYVILKGTYTDYLFKY